VKSARRIQLASATDRALGRFSPFTRRDLLRTWRCAFPAPNDQRLIPTVRLTRRAA
jgi:hypothetical protein